MATLDPDHAGTRRERGYDEDWLRLAAAVRETATTCHVCGGGPRSSDPWVADHVVPLSAGGARLDPANVKAAHRSCNSVKGAHSMNVLIRARAWKLRR